MLSRQVEMNLNGLRSSSLLDIFLDSTPSPHRCPINDSHYRFPSTIDDQIPHRLNKNDEALNSFDTLCDLSGRETSSS